MKTLAGFLALVLLLPVVAGAATVHSQVKKPTDVKDYPQCTEGMDPGTLCRYVQLNALTVRLPNVNPGLPPIPVKIVLPAGTRSITASMKLEVSPTTVCDPVPSDVYDGMGGVMIDCVEH
jgi:hypothetical protein